MLAKDLRKFFADMRTGAYFAIIAAEPYFADRFLICNVIVPGTEIIPAPDTDDELRLDTKWSHLYENRMGIDGHAGKILRDGWDCTKPRFDQHS